jgi:hypothetical protein
MSEFYHHIKSRYINRYMTILVKKKDAELNDFRNLISNQVRSVRVDGKDFVLEVDPKDYLVASFNELIRYAGKGLIAYEDFCLEPPLTSRSWRYVTLYYSLYFFAVAFGRIAGRSVIYIDSPEARSITNLFSLLAGSGHQVTKGNYVLIIDKPEAPLAIRDSLEIRLARLDGGGSHENSWSQFYNTLNTWIPGSKGRSLATVNGIRNCLAINTSIFSEARNNVNYRGKYTLKELDNLIIFLGPDKRSMSLDQLDREISATVRLSAKEEATTLQVAHTLGSFLYVLFKSALNDLHGGQPHPGSYYVKQLVKRIQAP